MCMLFMRNFDQILLVLFVQGASADVAAGEEVYSSFRKPVQESGQ